MKGAYVGEGLCVFSRNLALEEVRSMTVGILPVLFTIESPVLKDVV